MSSMRWTGIMLVSGCAILWACPQNQEAVTSANTAHPHSGPATSLGLEDQTAIRISDRQMIEQLLAQKEKLPDDPKLLETSARLLLEAGHFPAGIELLRRLLALQPKRCDLWLLRADAFLEIEDEESTFESYRSCLKNQPDHLESLFTLGGMLASRHPEEVKSLEEAINLWERYLSHGAADSRAAMVQKALPRLKQHLKKQ